MKRKKNGRTRNFSLRRWVRGKWSPFTIILIDFIFSDKSPQQMDQCARWINNIYYTYFQFYHKQKIVFNSSESTMEFHTSHPSLMASYNTTIPSKTREYIFEWTIKFEFRFLFVCCCCCEKCYDHQFVGNPHRRYILIIIIAVLPIFLWYYNTCRDLLFDK